MSTNATRPDPARPPRESATPHSTTGTDTPPDTAGRTHEPAAHTPSPSSERLLDRLTAAAVAAIPGSEHASVILYRHGRVVMQAASGAHVSAVEQQQLREGAGPCLVALDPPGEALVSDLYTDSRWPHLAPAALAGGTRSLLALALGPTDTPSGVLTVYSSRPHAFTAHARAAGAAFAAHTALAAESTAQLAGLERAVQTRDVIGQAKGILIERYGLTPAQAFDRLAHSSQHSNIKLAEVARWLVTQTTGHDPTPPVPNAGPDPAPPPGTAHPRPLGRPL